MIDMGSVEKYMESKDGVLTGLQNSSNRWHCHEHRGGRNPHCKENLSYATVARQNVMTWTVAYILVSVHYPNTHTWADV